MAITVTATNLSDDSNGVAQGIDGPYTFGAAITPSDSAASLTFLPRAINCAVAGTICCVWKDNSNSVLGIVPGVPLRVRPYAVAATGTTATGLVALK